jgi:hypothetical protein
MSDRIIEEIPQNNGAIVVMEIYRSGKTKDGRVITRQELREIYNNTTKFVLPEEVTIPLKFGHDDRDQLLKGKVIDLKLKRRRRKNLLITELSLIAKIQFFDEAYELFKTQKLPNVSAEIAPEGYTENGERHGQYLAGLALLGIDPPAIPWLKTDFQNDGSIYYYSLIPGRNLYKRNNMEPKTFAMEELTPIKEALVDVLASIEELIGAEEPAEEPTEEGLDASSETETNDFEKAQARIKELEAELEESKVASQSESAFSTLQEAGKVKAGDKEQFSKLVEKAGVEFALEFYSARPTVKMPPMQAVKKNDLKTSSTKKEPWKEFEAKWHEKYKKQAPHKSDEDIQKLAVYAAKLEYNQSVGGSNGTN